MKVAIVHDYLNEFGGAERVLKVLSEMYPKAPIYTAFKVADSEAARQFSGSDVREGLFAPILKPWKLYSPLRFLTPLIWKSLDLSSYDLVIASSSWYITRGFKVGKKTKVVCYCHTPPRYLYGYETSVNLDFLPVKIYAAVVNHFLRIYDFYASRTVDKWIVNSENVKARVKKFYRADSTVVYPPVDVTKIGALAEKTKREDFFLIASRIVGGKGIEEAVEAANKNGFKLKIVGEAAGYSKVLARIKQKAGTNVELLGRVEDAELYRLYAQAKGFIALAKNEDFGMTVVEAQAAGTPVIAYNGGGFKESVIVGVTGILVNGTSPEVLESAIAKFNKTRWNRTKIKENAKRFSKENFEKQIRNIISNA